MGITQHISAKLNIVKTMESTCHNPQFWSFHTVGLDIRSATDHCHVIAQCDYDYV